MAATPARPRQLALDLPVATHYGAEDFLVGPSNRDAWRLIGRWPDWPGSWLRLAGPAGSGKSHLAAIWAQASGGRRLAVAALAAADVPGLAACGAVAIEDCHRQPRDEAALFHLMNALKSAGGSLLVTGEGDPDQWRIATPDLLSRLRLAPQVTIGPPDDALLQAVLVKHFVDRQLVVDTGVVALLARRMERSFAAARALADALDRLSLERGRRITRALAAEALAMVESDRDRQGEIA